ncbi:hypothetical protein Droror1_Dr00010574 [Drosera rotundifolia]
MHQPLPPTILPPAPAQPQQQPHQYYQQPPTFSYPSQMPPPQQPQQQQQWMIPPTQTMWTAQHPLPQQQPNYQVQYQQQQQGSGPGGGADEVRTLWIGDLQSWMDEAYISSAFAATNEVVGVKVIRNKLTQQSEGYGFIEFRSHAAAERILQAYNNTLMPQVEQNFRLNWALYGAGERRQDDGPDYTIFVGDLSPDVTDYALLETFKAGYPSVKGAKVVMDRLTGRSKGYGFVRFSDENEQQRAMNEMNGVTISSRPMRTGPAATKKNAGPTAAYQNTQANQGDSDPNNTTIFVGNLASTVAEEHLTVLFQRYEEALRNLHGTQLGGQNIRLSWGHNPSNKQDPQAGLMQPQADPSQWAGYFGYPQGYGSYGYAAGAHETNMYYQGYQGYGNYAAAQPQQQVQQQQ